MACGFARNPAGISDCARQYFRFPAFARVQRLSENAQDVRQGQGKPFFCDGSVLFPYSTGAKKRFDAAIARVLRVFDAR